MDYPLYRLFEHEFYPSVVTDRYILYKCTGPVYSDFWIIIDYIHANYVLKYTSRQHPIHSHRAMIATWSPAPSSRQCLPARPRTVSRSQVPWAYRWPAWNCPNHRAALVDEAKALYCEYLGAPDSMDRLLDFMGLQLAAGSSKNWMKR